MFRTVPLRWFAALCAFVVLGLGAVSSANPQGDSGPTLTISVHGKGQPPNAFKGEKQAKGVELYAFKVYVYSVTYKVEKLVFRLFLNGRKIVLGENYTLWRDTDEDGRVDPEKDELLSRGKVEGRRVVFEKEFSFSSSSAFLVRADFPELHPGFSYVINLDPEETVIRNQAGVKLRLTFPDTLKGVEHYETYPLLSMTASLQSPVVVGDEDVTLFVDVIYLRGVEPAWSDLQNVEGWKLRDFPRMSEVRGFDLLYRRVTIKLRQPEGMDWGKYSIPPIRLSYRTERIGGEIRTISTPPLSVRKEKAHAEVRVAVRKISMADPIPYEMELVLDKRYVVPDDHLNEMRYKEFKGGFRVFNPQLEVVETEKTRIIRYRATLSYLGVPAKQVELPEENIPYVLAEDLARELLAYRLPQIVFPYQPIAVSAVWSPLVLWRDLVGEEKELFGFPLGWWFSVLPLGIGGMLLTLTCVKALSGLARRRRTSHLSWKRRIRAGVRLWRFMRQASGSVSALEVSSLIREYAGAAAGEAERFMRSAYFSSWFRKRHPHETDLLAILKKIELGMIEHGIDMRIDMSAPERKSIARMLKRVGRRETLMRLRKRAGRPLRLLSFWKRQA